MGHGGKRPGAGRPRALSTDQRIDVVVNYFARRDNLFQEKFNKAFDQHPELRATSSKLKKFKQSERAVWASLPEPVGQRDNLIDRFVDDRIGYIEESLKGNRMIHVSRPRLFRDRLLKQVAAWATEQFGVLVTPRQVETCLEAWAQEPDQPNDA